jgi:hypothetical protein
VVYSSKGERIINLDPYLNLNRSRPDIKVNTNPLLKRLVEAVNGIREIRISNIAQELSTIETTGNYNSLVIVPSEAEEGTIETQAAEFLKKNELKGRICQQYVVKDTSSRQILGLNGKAPGLYFLSVVSDNLLPEYKQQVDTFKIGEKDFCLVPANLDLSEIFVFPPARPTLSATEVVLNVYINRNSNTSQL